MYDTLIMEYEGCFGRGRSLDDIVAWVDKLPPIPETVDKALKLVNDPNSTPLQVAAVITRDPALATAVMVHPTQPRWGGPRLSLRWNKPCWS